MACWVTKEKGLAEQGLEWFWWDEEDRMSSCKPHQCWVSGKSIFRLLIELLH